MVIGGLRRNRIYLENVCTMGELVHVVVGKQLDLLCKSFTLSLQQIMASLSSLQLRLHQSQGLPSCKDSLPILEVISIGLEA